MSGKISLDPNAATLVGGEYIAGVQSGANVKITPNQIKTFVQGNGLADLLAVGNDAGATAVKLSSLSASTVLILNSSKEIVSSGYIAASDLQYLSGASGNLQNQINTLNISVSSLQTGRFWKPACRVATTSNIVLTGTQTIDGISLSVGDRVLVKDQTLPEYNGIKIVASGAWTDADDFTDPETISGATVIVQEGSVNADKQFICTTDKPLLLGADAITWVLSGGTTYTGTTNRIVISGSTVDIASNYIGQNTITTLGTIGTGVWQGSTIAAAYLDLSAKADIGSTVGAGTTILFDKDRDYGTEASPETGNITINTAGAIVGTVTLVVHNDGTAPTYGANTQPTSGSGTYVTGQVNYIYYEYRHATLIRYCIQQ